MENLEPHLLLSYFEIPVNNYSVENISSGYIHKSFKVILNGEPKYVLQQLSRDVFPDPDLLFHNFSIAAPFLESSNYSSFRWIRSKQGDSTYEDENGHSWRLLSFVPNSKSLFRIKNNKQVFECGRILGEFHILVDPIPIASFQIPLQGFHDLDLRLSAYRESRMHGLNERILNAKDLHKSIETLIALLQNSNPGEIPERICHNDTKLSNVLFHSEDDRALCLVDLDTLMPGYFYFDFGDLSRTVLDSKGEESKGPYREKLDMDLLSTLLAGIKKSDLHLSSLERDSLGYGMILMPFLHGIRALTDYYLGDPYYQVKYPDQNLVRAQNLISYASLVHNTLPQIQEVIKNELELS